MFIFFRFVSRCSRPAQGCGGSPRLAAALHC